MTAPVVFLGPSLRRDEARAILDADFLPPAGQGDIMRAIAARPPAIALIDGVFKDAPTVRHREIMWALGQGIPVFGAASMGALRAAELGAHGMIGVGLIYRWYRRFHLLADDAVAVTHGPPALGSPRLSEALVDIRRSLAAARRAGALGSREAQDHLAHQTALPFARRALPEALSPYRAAQKARDAAALLTRLAAHAEANDWPVPGQPQPAIVHAWLDDLADSGLSLDAGGQ